MELVDPLLSGLSFVSGVGVCVYVVRVDIERDQSQGLEAERKNLEFVIIKDIHD